MLTIKRHFTELKIKWGEDNLHNLSLSAGLIVSGYQTEAVNTLAFLNSNVGISELEPSGDNNKIQQDLVGWTDRFDAVVTHDIISHIIFIQMF